MLSTCFIILSLGYGQPKRAIRADQIMIIEQQKKSTRIQYNPREYDYMFVTESMAHILKEIKKCEKK